MQNLVSEKVKEKVMKIEPYADIILFGSRARNDFSEGSDWDYLILLDGKVDSTRTDHIRSVLYDIELETDEIINSIVRSTDEWNSPKYSVLPFRKNIENEGIRL